MGPTIVGLRHPLEIVTAEIGDMLSRRFEEQTCDIGAAELVRHREIVQRHNTTGPHAATTEIQSR